MKRHSRLVAAAMLALAGAPAAALGQTVPANAQVRALIAPRTEAVLAAQIPGRLISVAFRPGQSFRQGEVLFALDCRLPQAQWQRAQREVAHAERTLDMHQRLAQLGSGSRNERNQAEAAVDRARSDLAQLALTLEFCAVKAPFDGRVVERKAQADQVVAPGQPVLEVYDSTAFDIQLLVPSPWLSWLHQGRRFRLHLDETNQDHMAEVTDFAARIDPASQSLKVYARFVAASAGMLSGMTGTAFFAETAPAAAGATPSAPPPVAPPSAPPPRPSVSSPLVMPGADAVARPAWTSGR